MDVLDNSFHIFSGLNAYILWFPKIIFIYFNNFHITFVTILINIFFKKIIERQPQPAGSS